MQPLPHHDLPLGQRPQVVSSANSLHGRAGQVTVERYCLPHLWCLHIYQYEAVVFVDGFEIRIRPGRATVFPPGAQLEYHFNGLSPHVYAHFSVSEDLEGVRASFPILFDTGSEATHAERALKTVAANAYLNSLRAGVQLWELLWELSERVNQPGPRHPSVEQALVQIEAHLGEEISVTALARNSGISHNHLTRLFQAEFGTTVVGYIRRRRMEQARHLLEQTTLPLKVIARQVGCADARAFNAMMKKETGRPPGAWREARS